MKQRRAPIQWLAGPNTTIQLQIYFNTDAGFDIFPFYDEDMTTRLLSRVSTLCVAMQADWRCKLFAVWMVNLCSSDSMLCVAMQAD